MTKICNSRQPRTKSGGSPTRCRSIWRFHRFLAVMILVCGSANAQTSDSREFCDWVAEHGQAVESLDRPLEGSGLETFRKAIGSAQVVGIGESRHDTREQLLMKSVLVHHLVEDLGFRALVLEESFPHAESIDRYVTSGDGDLRQVMNQLAGWYLWDTEEMLEVIEWVRQFNSGREPDRKVRIFGMDVTAPVPGVQDVLATLAAAGVKTRLDAQALGFDLQRGDSWPTSWERYTALTADRRLELGQNYTELIEILRANRAAIVAAFSEPAFERTLLLGEIGKMGNDLFSSADRVAGGVIREHGMARTVLWIREHEMPGRKMIIWAHNLHVAKSSFSMPEIVAGELEPMGVQLSREFGDTYLVIGGTFGQGSYSSDLPPGERVFEPMSSDALDGALAEGGLPYFLIDLRGAQAVSGVSKWLHQARECRAQDFQAVMVPDTAFDLLYFVGNVSRSQPTALALQRYQASGARH